VRAPGPGQNLYRLSCILDRNEATDVHPAIAVITGMVKRNPTTFTISQ